MEQLIRRFWLKEAQPSMSTPHISLWLLKHIDNLLSQTLSSRSDGSKIIKSLKSNPWTLIIKNNEKYIQKITYYFSKMAKLAITGWWWSDSGIGSLSELE